jgi:CRP-like cAMP-binding protein
MAIKLEHFKPRLRPGRMIPHGATFTFELSESKEQVTLPMFLADFVLLCGGQFTIREIVEKIYRKQGAVPFRTLLETLYMLNSRGFLENADGLIERPWLTKQQLIKRKMHYDFRSNAIILGPGPQPIVFYVLSMAVFVLSAICLIFDWQSPIESGEQTPMLDPLYFGLMYLTNSLFLTGKHLVRAAQILALNGRVSEFTIRLAPWGIYLHTEDPQMENVNNSVFPALFYFSQLLVPFGILHILELAFGDTEDWLGVLACYLVFWELNPFRKTDFYKALRAVLMPHRLDSLAFVDTGINPRHQRFIFFCSVFGLVWLCFGVRVLESTGLGYGGPMISTLLHGPLLDKAMASIWITVWFSALFFMVHSFVETTSTIGSEQLMHWQLRLTRKIKLPSLKNHSEKKLIGILRRLPLFAHLSDEGLQRLIGTSQLFSAEAGTPILIAGEESHHLFILLEGSVAIEKGDLSSPILPTTIFGESALVEGGTRAATVVAREKSLCVKVPVSQLRQIARESHVIGELETFMTAIMVDQFFASSPLFRKLSREGIDFLSSRGKLDFVGAGQVIFQQGDPGDYFYMVIRGSVRAEINSANSKTIPQGGFFGEISLIANIPRTATIVAEEPSILFKISMEAFWEVLVQHIEMALFIESVSEQRLIEDMQLMIRTG